MLYCTPRQPVKRVTNRMQGVSHSSCWTAPSTSCNDSQDVTCCKSGWPVWPYKQGYGGRETCLGPEMLRMYCIAHLKGVNAQGASFVSWLHLSAQDLPPPGSCPPPAACERQHCNKLTVPAKEGLRQALTQHCHLTAQVSDNNCLHTRHLRLVDTHT